MVVVDLSRLLPGPLITRILGDLGISIEAMIQKEPPEGAADVPIIMLTRTVKERQINQAIDQIEERAHWARYGL